MPLPTEKEGVWIWSEMEPGDILNFSTSNREYTLRRERAVSGKSTFSLKGHPDYCPDFTPVRLLGQTDEDTITLLGFLGVGLYAEFAIIGKEETEDLFFSTSVVKAWSLHRNGVEVRHG